MTAKDKISGHKLSEFNGVQTPLHYSPERLFPPRDEATELSIACYRADYSASRISRAVEDADAHLLNLNLTSEVLPTGEVIVDLRISHRTPFNVVRSLERYGYKVIEVRDSSNSNDTTLSDRISELFAYINV